MSCGLQVAQQTVLPFVVGSGLGETMGPTEANPCVNQVGDLHLCVGLEVSLKMATTVSNRQFSEESMGTRRAIWCGCSGAVKP